MRTPPATLRLLPSPPPPWEAPAAVAGSSEPKPVEESDASSIKITTPTDQPADAPEPAPSAEDLSAVEKAVAEAAKATGATAEEKPAEEPAPVEESKDEPKKEDEPAGASKEDEPKADEPATEPEAIIPPAEGVAGAAVAAETSEPSVIKHHKVKRHPKHKKDDEKPEEKPEEKPTGNDEPDKEEKQSDQPEEPKVEEPQLNRTHEDLKLDVNPDIKLEDEKPTEDKPMEEAKSEDAAATPVKVSVNANELHADPILGSALAQQAATEEPKAEPEPEPTEPPEPPAASEPEPSTTPEGAAEPEAVAEPESAAEPDAEAEVPTPADSEAPKEDEPKEDEPKADEPSPVVIPSGPDAATTPESMFSPAAPETPSTPETPTPPEAPSPSLPEPQPTAGEAGAIAIPAPSADPPAAPAPVASNVPLNGKPPLTPVTHPRPLSVKLIVSLVAGVAIAAAAVGVGYTYSASPKLALADYLQKTADAKTSNFVLTSTQSTDGYRIAVKLSGKGDVTDVKNPKFDVTVTGQLSSDKPLSGSEKSLSGTLGGQAILVDKGLYFKLDDLSILDALVKTKPSADWYKLDLSKSTEANKCSDQTSALSAVLSKDVLDNIPVKDAKLTGMSKLDGSSALHYTGTVDNSKLQTVIDNANKKLSADCKLDIKSGDYQNQTIKYELWRGWSKDRLKLTVSDGSGKTPGVVTLDTSGYNKPVDIKAPAGAKDAAELFKGVAVLGAATQAVNPVAPATSATSSAVIHDTQRQSDLALYAAAYNAKAKNGFYPVTPPKVNVAATDPTTGQAYVVGKSTPTALGQIQYLPGGSCTGPAHTPGATGTRYLAIYALLEGSSTPYCLDVK